MATSQRQVRTSARESGRRQNAITGRQRGMRIVLPIIAVGVGRRFGGSLRREEKHSHAKALRRQEARQEPNQGLLCVLAPWRESLSSAHWGVTLGGHTQT